MTWEEDLDATLNKATKTREQREAAQEDHHQRTDQRRSDWLDAREIIQPVLEQIEKKVQDAGFPAKLVAAPRREVERETPGTIKLTVLRRPGQFTKQDPTLCFDQNRGFAEAKIDGPRPATFGDDSRRALTEVDEAWVGSITSAYVEKILGAPTSTVNINLRK